MDEAAATVPVLTVFRPALRLGLPRWVAWDYPTDPDFVVLAGVLVGCLASRHDSL